jgi:hypothetical protein
VIGRHNAARLARMCMLGIHLVVAHVSFGPEQAAGLFDHRVALLRLQRVAARILGAIGVPGRFHRGMPKARGLP